MNIRYTIICAGLLAAMPAMAADNYATNYPADAKITNGQRTLTAVKLNSPADGAQTVESSQQTDRLLYHDRTDHYMKAAAGETVTASFDWNGAWMHGYVYIDLGNDGQFDTDTDLLAFSY
ncbi:MAG: hypothetical protein K2M97_00050, partial [Muribaculaceae bacterium]|nr:hypothetical protein [Muribaculaceae bacterium]